MSRICSRGRYSNLSTAFIRPMLPSWIRSRNCRPRLVYFLAIEITSRSCFRHLALGAARFRLASGHLAVDFLQVLDRNADFLLQIDQFLLLLDDRGLEALERVTPRLCAPRFRSRSSAGCIPCREIP